MSAPTRAAWACSSCPSTSPGRIGSSGNRSTNGWTASAASPAPERRPGIPAHREPAVIITLVNSGRSFQSAADEALLDAAQTASLNLPHSCRGGNCGACKARLLRGEINYPNGAPLGLSQSEVADGLILMCQARARTDLSLETFDVRA